MTKDKKRYDREFKKKAVLLTYERSTIVQVEKELGITSKLLNGWRQDYQKFGDGSFPGYGNLRLSLEQQKIHELEKKIKKSQLEFEILSSAVKYLHQGRPSVFHFMARNEKKYSIGLMCKALGMNRNTYRKWKNEFISESQKRKIIIKKEITSIFFASKQRYGGQRIKIELEKLGYQISGMTVSRFMRELGLNVVTNKKVSKHKK